MDPYDSFDDKPLKIKGGSVSPVLGPDPVNILLEMEDSTRVMWEAFPRAALRTASTFADEALRPPKTKPYAMINSVTIPKGAIKERALVRILSYIKKTSPPKKDFKGQKQFFPEENDTLAFKLDVWQGLAFLNLKQTFNKHPLLKSAIYQDVGTKGIAPSDMVRIFRIFKNDEKLTTRMVANFVDHTDMAANGNTNVSTDPNIAKTYITYFKHVGGLEELVSKIDKMRNGKRARERGEARRQAATIADVSFTRVSACPAPQAWPMLPLPTRVQALRPSAQVRTKASQHPPTAALPITKVKLVDWADDVETVANGYTDNSSKEQ